MNYKQTFIDEESQLFKSIFIVNSSLESQGKSTDLNSESNLYNISWGYK